MKWVYVWVAVVAMTGCTADAWRAGAQESAKQQCLQAPIGEQQRCLDKLKDAQR